MGRPYLCSLIAVACLASALADCRSQLTTDCGSATGTACVRCARSHQSDLTRAGCTVKEVGSLCGVSPGPSPPGPVPGRYDLKMVLLNNSDAENGPAVGGRCLDGSPAGYYYGAPLSTGGDTTKWSIFLKGGGACSTEQACKARAVMKKGLGSSTFWTEGEFGGGFTSNDSASNPDFYDGHRVYVPYCTGDVHSGTRTNATAETWGLWFDGHLNFARILDDLKAKRGLSDARHVLLGGSSAGGFGTFFNADYLAAQLPNAAVKAAPQAGWFVPGDPDAVPSSRGAPLNFTAKEVTHSSQLGSNAGAALWLSYANPPCAEAIGADNCGSVHNMYKYIETPLLVVENQYDTNQIFDTVGFCPKPAQYNRNTTLKALADDYIAYYGDLMRKSIAPQIQGHGQTKAKGKDGLFFPSCLGHGGFPDTKVQSVSDYVDLIGDWFFQRGKYSSHVVIDDCKMTDGLPCNPTCKALSHDELYQLEKGESELVTLTQ